MCFFLSMSASFAIRGWYSGNGLFLKLKPRSIFLTENVVTQVEKIKQILLDLIGLKESQAKLNLIPGRPTCEHKNGIKLPSSKLTIALIF